MTKPQTKLTITLETIIEAFDGNPLPQAREILYDSIGAQLDIEGVIEKVIKRDGGMKLMVKPHGVSKPLMIFAEFTDEKEREKIKQNKFRKGSKVSINGDFRTAGYCAATINNCRVN